MSSVYIGKSLRKFESAPQFSGYTKVVLRVSDDIEYSAGIETGRTLTSANPWGSQELAEDILAQIKGFAYQPYTASGAIVDAAAELGDAVSVNGVYSGVYGLTRRYGGIQYADLSAPSDEEIDHEYPYKSPQDRRVTRQFREVRASLSIQADRITAEVAERKSDMEAVMGELSVQAGHISAKVSKTGGNASSFGWDLTENYWALKSNNTEVLRATKDGLEINGIIRALPGGTIGGFDITRDSLSYNNHTWGGTNTTGIYIGPNGIQCGKDLKLFNNGRLEAVDGYFSGYVKAGKIQSGDDAGYFPGSGLESHSVCGSQIGYNTISTAYTSSGINTSLGYADYAYGCFKGWNTITALHAGSLDTNDLTIDNHQINRSKIRYMNSSGGISTANVLVWVE